MSLLRGSVINLVFKIVGVAFGLFFTLITARLGTEERGIYSLFTLVAQVFITLFAGFGSALTYRVSRHGEHPEAYLVSVLCFGAAIGGLFALVLLAVSVVVPSPPYGQLGILALAAPVLLVVPYVNGMYLGKGDIWRLNLNNLAAPFGCVVLLCVVVLLKKNIALNDVLISWSATQVAVAVIVMIALGRSMKFEGGGVQALKALVPFSKEVGLANLVGLLNYRADLLLVQALIGLSAVGVYSVAVAIAEMLWFVSSSVTLAAYSRIGREESVASANFVLRILHLNLFLLAAIAPFLFLLSYIAVPYCFGRDYAGSVGPLLILLPGTLLYGGASTISAFFTNHLGRPDLPKKIALLSLVVNILMSIVLLPFLGINGAAAASSFAYFIAIGYSVFLFKKNTHLEWSGIMRPSVEAVWGDFCSLVRAARLW